MENFSSNIDRQTTSHLMMIRPVQFSFNKQTSGNNAFQSFNDDNAQELALKEFDDFVLVLRQSGIDVTVVNDTPAPHTPDSIFPNNWISFHQNGDIILYPMFAENRRQERKPEVLEHLRRKFNVAKSIDLTKSENHGKYLEGTGSMVLDRANKIAYACLSQRTDSSVLEEFCRVTGFTAEVFTAVDEKGFPIYHTNVMMCIADRYAVICLDSIPDIAEKKSVQERLNTTHKEIIVITLDQMNHFAGNMLQVTNASGQPFLIMSTQAFRALSDAQRSQIKKYNPILHSSLETIERNGGGSARCMMAEVFLPLKK